MPRKIGNTENHFSLFRLGRRCSDRRFQGFQSTGPTALLLWRKSAPWKERCRRTVDLLASKMHKREVGRSWSLNTLYKGYVPKALPTAGPAASQYCCWPVTKPLTHGPLENILEPNYRKAQGREIMNSFDSQFLQLT